MTPLRVGSVIIVIFIMAGLLNFHQGDFAFVSPFFLNEVALSIFGLILIFSRYIFSGFVVSLIFLLGVFQNTYFLKYLGFYYAAFDFVSALFYGLVFLGIIVLSVATFVVLWREKDLKSMVSWGVSIFLWLLFITSTYLDHNVLIFIILFLHLLTLYLALKRFKTDYKCLHVFWTSWMLYGSLEVLKMITFLVN